LTGCSLAQAIGFYTAANLKLGRKFDPAAETFRQQKGRLAGSRRREDVLRRVLLSN
jgi:hypothetical protein